MRSAAWLLLGTLVACGHDPPRATSPPTETRPKPATPSRDVTGSWCGERVSSAASCTGKDAIYLELSSILGASLSAAGNAIGGQICAGYDHDCTPLETSSFTFENNTLLLVGTIKQAGSKNAESFRGTFTLGADDVLVGELVPVNAKAPIKKSLYRIK